MDIVAEVDPAAETEISRFCAEEIRNFGQVDDTTCLQVQMRFDVAPEFLVDEFSPEAVVLVTAVITPAGRQIDAAFADLAFPGTVGNSHNVLIPGGTAGSTIKFDSGSNLVGFTTHTYTVPGELPVLTF